MTVQIIAYDSHRFHRNADGHAFVMYPLTGLTTEGKCLCLAEVEKLVYDDVREECDLNIH